MSVGATNQQMATALCTQLVDISRLEAVHFQPIADFHSGQVAFGIARIACLRVTNTAVAVRVYPIR